MLILMGEWILSFVGYSNDVVVVVVVGSLAGYCCSYGVFTVAECLTLEVMVVIFIYICFIRKVKFKTAWDNQLKIVFLCGSIYGTIWV